MTWYLLIQFSFYFSQVYEKWKKILIIRIAKKLQEVVGSVNSIMGEQYIILILLANLIFSKIKP